jgi:2-amino-4-hydroxy-6-hydroxymethyldihydropteridine diphosphokinase
MSATAVLKAAMRHRAAEPETNDRPASMRRLTRCWIGLGANLGDPFRAFSRALESLQALPSTRVVALSRLYRSEPIDASGPDFVNAVAAIDTELPPKALLAELQRIEREAGRKASSRNAPRPLDLDLLACGGTVCHGESLQLPHPRMHQRAFVLVPLAELAPALDLPGIGPIAACLGALSHQRLEAIGRLPGWPSMADSTPPLEDLQTAGETSR